MVMDTDTADIILDMVTMDITDIIMDMDIITLIIIIIRTIITEADGTADMEDMADMADMEDMAEADGSSRMKDFNQNVSTVV